MSLAKWSAVAALLALSSPSSAQEFAGRCDV